MIILLFVLSFVAFVLIELPRGDILDRTIENLRTRGVQLEMAAIDKLEVRYGLKLPFYSRYFMWLGNLLQGDMGESFLYGKPVNSLVGQRLALTASITLLTLVLTYAISIPIGIYSATHQYSVGDYIFTVFGFIGLATPNFLLALILMFVVFRYLGWSVGGLFSPEYEFAPWSLGKIVDFLKHLPIPLIVIGTSGTAGLIRVMRATLLDELRKAYVVTGRAKGQSERRLLFRYPIRVAINPMVSTIGGLLPALVSGATLTSIVISLPTVGPLLLEALQAQDMYLAGSLVMLLGGLGMLGTLISDLLLVVVDPRIRFERGAQA